MFVDGWFGLVRVLLVGTCAHAALLAVLRGSGTHTLSGFRQEAPSSDAVR
ncbi:hypothetical protein [Nocardioides eburneiflavus]|nr:hypothetical protein [Nocardioides eburneiflavus]